MLNLGHGATTAPELAEEGKRQVPAEWSFTYRDYPQVCLHELFEAQVKRTPEATAVADSSQQLTYAQLNARANQLARRLRKLGVGPEVLVGIGVERSAELLVALLGILKAGGAYVPLDPEYPQERLAFMAEDSGFRILVTQQSFERQWSGIEAERVCLDGHRELIQQESSEDLARGAAPDNLIYVIYTSGSTGWPKGVLTSHRSLVNLLEFARVRPGFTAQDTFLALNTISFDMSKPELFLPLVVGGRVFVACRGVVNDMTQFEACLAQSGATVLQGPPSLWRLLIESGWKGGKGYKIICGGEVLGGSLAGELLKRCGSVWNGYGPTETTVWATMFQVVSADSPILIGTPVWNTQAYIVDSGLQPVPVGEPGELYVGGVGLARGYLNRPQLTGERFISNPFSHQPQARLYKTGDLARHMRDGQIEFLGRADHQVQVRGFRVETGEIESVLAEHPGVQAATVVAREDLPGETRLAAYVVPRAGQAPEGDELRTFLKRKLPEYMLPARWEFLRALPLTPSGKVDRQALSRPGTSRPSAAEASMPPRTEMERKLERIFAQVLGLDWVGVDEDFFDLGGDSLSALRLCPQVEAMSGRTISLATLFQAPSVRKLAAVIADPQPPQWLPGVLPIQPFGTRPVFFCAGGGPFGRLLAQRVGRDQPFLGLILEEDEMQSLPAPFRVEDMAAILVSKMRHEQPAGPYFLGGWCFYGFVAYEMAQQLRAQGEEVGLLLVIDTELQLPAVAPSGSQELSTRLSRLGMRANLFFVQLRRRGVRYVRERFASRWEFFRSRLNYRVYKLCLRRGIRIRNKWCEWDYMQVVGSLEYRPQPYAGSMVLLRPEPPLVTPRLEKDDLGWSEFVRGELQVHFFPEDIKLMFREPRVEFAAKKLRDILLEAQAKR